MADKEISITREKREAGLIAEYEECLGFFEKRLFDVGVHRLRKLLQNKLIHEADFAQLRHAIYISLGEVYEKELKLMNESMHYLHKALRLNPQNFTLWTKLARICVFQGYFAQAEQAFNNAIQYAPGVSYQNIIYQALTHISFLADNMQQLTARTEYLISQQFNVAHNKALQEYASQYEIQEKLKVTKKFGLKNTQRIQQENKQDSSQGLLNSNEITIETNDVTSSSIPQPSIELTKEIQGLLKEKSEILLRQTANPIFSKLPVSMSKSQEFTIYIDKLTWGSFLKIINIISKMFVSLIRGEATYKKDKKLNAIYALLKQQQHSLLNMIIWIKDKREAPPNEADNWNISKKVDKNTTQQQQLLINNNNNNLGNNNSNSFNNQQIQLSQIQGQGQTNGSQTTNSKGKNVKILTEGVKKSSRIKENTKNQIPINVNQPVDEYMREAALKGKFDLKQRLLSMQNEVYSKVDGVDQEIAQSQLNTGFKGFINENNGIANNEQQQQQQSDEAVTKRNTNMEVEDENNNNQEHSKEGINSQFISATLPPEKRLQMLDTYCNDDFMGFFSRIKHQAYFNLLELIEDILNYFLTNQDRQAEKDKCKQFLSEDYQDKSHQIQSSQSPSSVYSYSPHLLLNNLDGGRNYKSEISKLLVRMYSQFQQNLFKTQHNQLLTSFELLMDEINKMSQQFSEKKELASKKRDKLKSLHSSVRWMQFEFLSGINPQSLVPVQTIRIYHSLALFYSHQSFEAVNFAQQALNKLTQLLPQIDQKQQNSGDKNRKSYAMMMFWIADKGISSNFTEQIQDRIVENKFKKEIRLTATKLMPLGDKGEDELFIFDDQDNAEASLKEHLVDFLGTFESRVRERGLDDSNDLYYRNVFEILQNKKLDSQVFLENTVKILLLFFELQDQRIQEFRRTTPALEKLFRFEGLCEEFLKRFSLAGNNTNNNNTSSSSTTKQCMLSINVLFLKALFSKIFVGVQPGEPVSLFPKLFSCYATSSVIMLGQQSNSKQYHQSVSFVAFLIHDLTQQLPPQLHQEIYKQWHFHGYFTVFISNIFKYLDDLEDSKKGSSMEIEINFTVEKHQQLNINQEQQGSEDKQNQQQTLETQKQNDNSVEQETKINENKSPQQNDISITVTNQQLPIPALQPLEKGISILESSDDEESEEEENEDMYGESYVLDQLKTIYRCFYGLKIKGMRQILTNKWANVSTQGNNTNNNNTTQDNQNTNNNNSNDNNCVFSSLLEIRLFVMFTRKACPQYLTNLVCPLSQQFISTLIGAFDYIKKNEEEWALCPNLGIKKDQFQSYMKDKKVAPDNNILEFLQNRANINGNNNLILGNTTNSATVKDPSQLMSSPSSFTCFCDRQNCFTPVMENDNFLLHLLLLIGRALSQYDPRADIHPNDPESKPKFKTRRQALKNAEKMFNFYILLCPSDFLGWYSLGDVFSGLSFMYFDASVFEPMSTNVAELKDIYLSAKRVYHYILEHFNALMKTMSLGNTNNYIEEVKEDILLLNIVKMYERKSIYLMSLSPIQSDYDYIRESIVKKQRIASILDKIHTFDYDVSSSRMIVLMEVFVTRIHYQKFHSATFETHFRRLKQLQIQQSELQEGSQKNTRKRALSKGNTIDSNSSFKGEYYDQEGLCEFCISIWKVFKRYLQLLKVIQGKCLRKEETIAKIVQDISKKQQIKELSEIATIVLDDIEETVNELKKIEPKLFVPVSNNERELKIQEYFEEKSTLNLRIGCALKLSQIACSILSKRIVLELEAEDCSERIIQAVESIQIILNNSLILMKGLSSKHSNKKLKYKRFVIRSFFYSSQMIYQLNNDFNSAAGNLSEIFNLKLDEIVSYYTHFENQPLEKDPKLSILYTKDLCFMLEKYKYVKLMSTLLRQQKDTEKLRALNKKTVKAMIQQFEDQPDRLNKIFNQLYLITLNDLLDVVSEGINEQLQQKGRKTNESQVNVVEQGQVEQAGEDEKQKEVVKDIGIEENNNNKEIQQQQQQQSQQQQSQSQLAQTKSSPPRSQLPVDSSIQSSSTSHSTLKKWIFELYTVNIKGKNIYKHIESDSEMSRKLKQTIVNAYCLLENVEVASESFDNMYSRSIKYLEDIARKKKAPSNQNNSKASVNIVDDKDVGKSRQADDCIEEEEKTKKNSQPTSENQQEQIEPTGGDLEKKREMEIEN